MDALYFTVTALTNTGFGDITLQGVVRATHLGRLHDLWCHPVLTAVTNARATPQGSLCVS